MNRFAAKFQHWMEYHPVKANSLLCFSLWVCGDSLAQYSEFRIKQQQQQQQQGKDDDKEPINRSPTFAQHYDYLRTAQCAGYGAFITGPLVALWYPWLDKMTVKYLGNRKSSKSTSFTRVLPSSSPWTGPIFKVLLDEFVMDPPQIAVFFGYMTVCEGQGWKEFQQKLRSEFWTTWLTSLAVWPVVLLGTFRFLPLYYQAPVINACAIVWDGFLSYRNNAGRIAKDDDDGVEHSQEPTNTKVDEEKTDTKQQWLPSA